MSLYAIGDLHLSLGSDKPMDIFGARWENYVEKICKGFEMLTEDDVCVICGDISWAMELRDTEKDFRFIHELPGKKVFLKGNHDYWWTSAAKMNAFFAEKGFDSLTILHNNYIPYGNDVAICGTRGWFYEESRGPGHDKKMIDREVLRLETSLKAAGEREKYVFLHYPPRYGGYTCPEILSLLREYNAKVCCSGHLHAESLRLAFNGWEGCTKHFCVSGDYLNFCPCKIL